LGGGWPKKLGALSVEGVFHNPVSMNEADDFGPAMAALTERQRAFVMAMIEFPGITQQDAARRAGYSDPGPHSSAIRVQGHYLAHNPAIQAAIREEAGKRLNAASLTAAGVLLKLLSDDAVEPKDRIKAAGMLLDRSGFGAAQTINVNKTVTDRTGTAMLDRIKELALRLNVDPTKLLGANVAPAAEVVEAEFQVVTDENPKGENG
jgi:hypothetical protein